MTSPFARPDVVCEPLARPGRFLNAPPLTRDEVKAALVAALARIDRNLDAFGDGFPAPSSDGGVYPVIGNVEWTSGFWSGMVWLAYEASGEPRYRAAAERQVESFADRIERRIETAHHDLGFLYSLSCVAAYRLTGSVIGKVAALAAARALMERYNPIAGVIQAWGDLNDPTQRGRMIVDCNLNLPLLYWAGGETGDPSFAAAANRHLAQAAQHIVRPDASTFHTFFMDTLTGRPIGGQTHQGFSDSSCWSRGQAWGISGFALAHRYAPDAALIGLSRSLANYFLNRLPDDDVCAWDLIFTGEDAQRDSSAAAIAVCGLLELQKSLPLLDPDRAVYAAAAGAIGRALITRYVSADTRPGAGLVAHAVYHMPNGVGVDESCIWGDYFYLEALVRLNNVWEPYW